MDEAIESLRHDVPLESQDDIARVVMQLIGRVPSIYRLTPEADLDEADAAIARGDFTTDEEVRAIWAKHGR